VVRSTSQTHRYHVTEPKKTPRRRRSRGRRRPSAASATAPPPTASLPDPTPALPESTAEAAPLDLELGNPEITFAARAAARPPEPDRPFPTNRRAIFFDVENTSRPQHIARVIDFLRVDRQGYRTDFVAVGNWRVIGHDTARLLAGHGATLLHSAPSVGVKDWSDLRIAVAAGVWLGTARPGDALEIITDDRAFDAVGDVATGLGVAFRRLSYRGLTGMREIEPVPVAQPPVESQAPGRRRRGRRGGQGRREAPSYAPPPPVRQPLTAAAEPHTAPHDELLGVARELIRVSPSRAVTLDSLANALKGRGFSRTPGSPRLITRLRRIRELVVSRSGHITLVDPQGEVAAIDAGADSEPIDVEPQAFESTPVPAPEDHRREAGAPRDERSWEERRAEVDAAQASRAAGPATIALERPGPPGEPSRDDGRPRRRTRRGGRRRRRHGAPAPG
jgi:hypothetical protein